MSTRLPLLPAVPPRPRRAAATALRDLADRLDPRPQAPHIHTTKARIWR